MSITVLLITASILAVLVVVAALWRSPARAAPAAPDESWESAAQREMGAFCDVGGTFKYLGRDLLVLECGKRVWAGHGSFFKPVFVCQYADESGRIHDIEVPRHVAMKREAA